MRDFDDQDISIVEDLDPEPATRGWTLQAREVVLGLALLIGVLSWAGWQWWDQEGKANIYRQGQQAEYRQRWEEAYAKYSAISGYKDADIRAQEAERLIKERDRCASEAIELASNQEWAASLKALQEVHRIQADYWGTALLPADVEQHVYQDALEGVVALRTGADPPGLYYSKAGKWFRLHKSDKWSRVLSEGTGEYIIYDVPGEGWTPLPTPLPSTFSDPFAGPVSAELKGRQLMVAWPQAGVDEPGFAPLAFDPSRHDYYRSGKNGVWALAWASQIFDWQSPFRGEATTHGTIAYQRADTTITSTLVLTGTGLAYDGAKWAVMAMDPDGEHLLMADWDLANDGSKTVRLHYAGPVGENPRLVYTHNGDMGNAQISPDSRFVLVSTYSPIPLSRMEKQSMVLIDLDGEMPPRTIAEAVTAISGVDSSLSYDFLTAAFLPTGPFAGKIALSTRYEDGYAYDISVVDPIHAEAPIAQVKVNDTARVAWTVAMEEERLVFFSQRFYGGSSDSDPAENRPVMIMMVPGATPIVSRLPVDDFGSRVSVYSVQQGYLVYGGEEFRRIDRRNNIERSTIAFYSLPLEEISSSRTRPTEIYRQTVSSNWSGRFTFGQGLFAYLDSGELHARTYDSKTDVLLETGVQTLYQINHYDRWTWLR
ncbi:MAG TPA: hypothetical protein VEX13_05630 [Chloroflexia bacterium]|nr:hypothetical protein [Chloroflexia bacterium]